MRKILFLSCFVFLFAGCYDKFYGPSLQNGFDQEITIDIYFENGKINSSIWPSCRTGFIGNYKNDIYRVVIIKNDVILHDLNKSDLANYLNQENNHRGYSVWKINSSGISFETENSCDQK